LFGGWFAGSGGVSLLVSVVVLVSVSLGGGWSGDFNSLSVGLMAVGMMEAGFGFVEISGVGVGGFEVAGVGGGGVAATDLGTWAANSARVAGRGRPGPQSR
jgi:hypothetical protein